MIILLDGESACGKSGLSRRLSRYFMANMKDLPVHFVHYEGSRDDTYEYNRRQYQDMFRLFVEGFKKRHFIVDRPHVGEAVWAKLFKDYDGDYVYDLERDFIIKHPAIAARTLQFFIFDNVDDILDREAKRKDGYSYNSSDKEKKQIELDLYVEKANKSRLNTHIMWLDKLSGENKFDASYEAVVKDVEDFAI